MIIRVLTSNYRRLLGGKNNKTCLRNSALYITIPAFLATLNAKGNIPISDTHYDNISTISGVLLAIMFTTQSALLNIHHRKQPETDDKTTEFIKSKRKESISAYAKEINLHIALTNYNLFFITVACILGTFFTTPIISCATVFLISQTLICFFDIVGMFWLTSDADLDMS